MWVRHVKRKASRGTGTVAIPDRSKHHLEITLSKACHPQKIFGGCLPGVDPVLRDEVGSKALHPHGANEQFLNE